MNEPFIFTTAAWGATEPAAHNFPQKLAEGIVVHNTQSANRAPGDNLNAEKHASFQLARSIQHEHMHRTPPFADTGQHFTISRGGLILEGRHGSLAAARNGRVVRGAHAKSAHDRANKVLFGIEVEGDNRIQAGGDHVTPQQFQALSLLCAWLSFWGHFDSSHIVPHLAVQEGHTDCPGKFTERIEELKARVHEIKAQIIEAHN